MTDTTPPTPPAQPATPGQPAAPGVRPPAPYPSAPPQPGQIPPGGYLPPPPGYYPPPPGWVPPGYRPVPVAPDGRPLASFVDRLLAFILDSVIVGAAAMVFVIPAFIWWFSRFATQMEEFSNSYDPLDPNTPPDLSGRFFGDLFLGYLVLFAVILAVTLGLTYVYQVEMAWRSGQTIGKRVMKLQVAPAEPGTERSRMMFVKRWAVERVGGQFVPFFSYLDGLWQLWDKPLQQCLHDKAAHTVVVKIG